MTQPRSEFGPHGRNAAVNPSITNSIPLQDSAVQQYQPHSSFRAITN